MGTHELYKYCKSSTKQYIALYNSTKQNSFIVFLNVYIFLNNKCVQNKKYCSYLLSLMSFHIEKLTQKYILSIQFNY